MKVRRRRWPWVLLGLAAALFVAKHVLLDTAAPPNGAFVIDLPALHRAAIEKGALPERIEVEKVATFAFPRTFVVAGDGFHLHPMVLLAHRVVWRDRSLIIDTAMGPAAAQRMPGSKLDQQAFGRVLAAMKQASAIVFTHEHVDHVGGVAAAPDPAALVKQVTLTREQLASPRLERGDFPAGSLDRFTPLVYEGLHAVAPGVVLQKAPGHSPGSQLVYVELASGQRFLFVGDIAWSKDNLTRQTGRPRVATLLMGEDRPAVAAQVKALAQLPSDVHLVIAHDPAALEQELREGLIHQGFTAH